VEDVEEANRRWNDLWKGNNDEVDRRIRETQNRLLDKCVRKYTLDWRDVEMRPYPNDERATYYHVQFTLTLIATRELLCTWTEWVRIPGGHTHLGCVGSKLLDAPSGFSGEALLEYARNASGLEFAAPPVV